MLMLNKLSDAQTRLCLNSKGRKAKSCWQRQETLGIQKHSQIKVVVLGGKSKPCFSTGFPGPQCLSVDILSLYRGWSRPRKLTFKEPYSHIQTVDRSRVGKERRFRTGFTSRWPACSTLLVLRLSTRLLQDPKSPVLGFRLISNNRWSLVLLSTTMKPQALRKHCCLHDY